MQYVSTRGGAKADFAEVLLGGPAPDGGLWLPESWPHFSPPEIAAMAGRPYAEIAFKVMRPFIGDAFTDAEFRADVDAAYASFVHADVVPLVALSGDRHVLELFHGPTLAFKDVAMQLLGRLFARALKKQNRRATVLVATSGDTGSAAIAALKGQPNVDVVVMHPKGRTSDVQRCQMTTVLDSNVHNIALEGTFDDTQSIVKDLFADRDFASGVSLTAVNSINFARIMAQCVYYFTAALALDPSLKRRAHFVVPTGNFGDVFAGEAAARMGLPIEKLVVATNSNDILARALETGVYSSGSAEETLSPSMDIQVASNFERALFEAANRDAAWVARAMADFQKTRTLTIPAPVLAALRARYVAGAADDDETVAAIGKVYRASHMVIDPHTAVGVAVADKLSLGDVPVIFLATAHPAKFPDAVSRATGISPALPAHMSDLLSRKERYTVLANSVSAVRDFVHTSQVAA
jgi:threonine synthase